jgi:hypothetical protein
MSLQQVSPKQLAELLAVTIPAGLPILITGMPGIGKTEITREAALAADADFVVTHPVVEDPTDRKGIPWGDPKSQSCVWYADETTKQLCNAKKRTVWLMDDLGQATPAVQAAHMQWLLNRGVNGHHLSDLVTIVAATNRRIDRAGVSGILEPVKSRFFAIVELVASLADSRNWAFDNGWPATLIAFLSFRPEFLAKFEPSADLTNSPLPRTWSHVAEIEKLKLSDAVQHAAFAGAVGEAAAVDYIGFRKLAASITSIEEILLNPDKVEIPKEPSQLYATVVGLSMRATDKNFSRIGVYAQRLVDTKRGDFAVLLIRDITRRNPKLTYSDTFIKLNSGEIGKLITGSK